MLNDVLAKVLVDKAGGGEADSVVGALKAQGVDKLTLVVVKVLDAIVLGGNINNNVNGIGVENSKVTRAQNRRVGVLGQLLKHKHSQGLVGVELARVGSNNGAHGGLLFFGRNWAGHEEATGKKSGGGKKAP